MSKKVLVVNADDFGFTRDVNRGIVDCHRRGILTATTLMANGRAFDDAVELARENPSLDIGCHLVLIGEHSLVDRDRPLPRSVGELLTALAGRRLRPYDELRAQVEKILSAGLRPIHLDTHKHTHLLPPVLDAVARLSQEFRIPWVRRPYDIPDFALLDGVPAGTRWTSRLINASRQYSSRILRRYGCRATDHFLGFQITGRYHTQQLVALLRHLPDGVTEFMCHPGYCTDELRSAPTRLKESRDREREALVAPEVKVAMRDAGIELASYRQL